MTTDFWPHYICLMSANYIKSLTIQHAPWGEKCMWIGYLHTVPTQLTEYLPACLPTHPSNHPPTYLPIHPPKTQTPPT